MLALKGYEKTNGFSVMNTDELFFISGGSSGGQYFGDTRPMIPASPDSPCEHGSGTESFFKALFDLIFG